MPNTNADGFHENENAGHDVTQVRSDGSSAVLIDNSHGTNSVVSSDGSKVHLNGHNDQHSVTQIQADGSRVVIITNGNGSNTIIHSDDGPPIHINTMHDG